MKSRWRLLQRYRETRFQVAAGVLSASLAILLFFESDLVFGGPLEDCYRAAESRLDVRPCLETLLSEFDAQLIEAEQFRRQRLMELANVTGCDAALIAFEQAAKDFRVFRESACSLARIQAEPGTGAGDFERDCHVRMTGLWINEVRSHSSLD